MTHIMRSWTEQQKKQKLLRQMNEEHARELNTNNNFMMQTIANIPSVEWVLWQTIIERKLLYLKKITKTIQRTPETNSNFNTNANNKKAHLHKNIRSSDDRPEHIPQWSQQNGSTEQKRNET